jgi:Ni/Fe-hydrogenase subunit HybB-like protein
MAAQFIDGIKTVNAATGIHGMENAAATTGFVMVIIVFGTRDMKKEHGGILRGIILPGLAELVNYFLAFSLIIRSHHLIHPQLFILRFPCMFPSAVAP